MANTAKAMLSRPLTPNILNRLLDLPISTLIARLLMHRCRSCGRGYLESALINFCDNGANGCRLCSPIVVGLGKSIELIFLFLGIERDDLRGFLSEPWTARIICNHIRGVTMFGRSRPQIPSAPVIAVWEITNECNLSCVYCHADGGKALPDELTKEEKFSVVDELASMGTVALMMAGGEPLCSPDLFDVIRRAHGLGLYTVVITNGLLLTKKNAKRLAEIGLDYIKVSIDSADPKLHDSLRGEGTWKRAVSGIGNCISVGLTTGIAFTLTRTNAEELPRVIALAKRIGVKRVIVFNFVPSGRGKNVVHLDLSGPERKEILDRAFEETYRLLTDSGGMEISSTAPQSSMIALTNVLGRVPVKKWLKGAKSLTTYGRIQGLAGLLSGGCSAGITVISISPNGDVKPCDLMPITVGNIRNRGLKEIWLDDGCLGKLRDRSNVKGWCASCPHLLDCGGCRSRAHAYFDDLLASDPNCPYVKSLPRERP